MRSRLLLAVTIVATFLFLAAPTSAYADYHQYIDGTPFANYFGLTATGLSFQQTNHHLQCYGQLRAPPAGQAAYTHMFFGYTSSTDTYSYSTQNSYVLNTSLITEVFPNEPARSFFCQSPGTVPSAVFGNYWGVFGGAIVSSASVDTVIFNPTPLVNQLAYGGGCSSNLTYFISYARPYQSSPANSTRVDVFYYSNTTVPGIIASYVFDTIVDGSPLAQDAAFSGDGSTYAFGYTPGNLMICRFGNCTAYSIGSDVPFAIRLSTDGTVLIYGSIVTSVASSLGKVVIMQLQGITGYIVQTTITAPFGVAAQQFGFAIDFDWPLTTILIGAPMGFNSLGCVYVFNYLNNTHSLGWRSINTPLTPFGFTPPLTPLYLGSSVLLPNENATTAFAGMPMSWNITTMSGAILYYRSLDTEFTIPSFPRWQQTTFPVQQLANTLNVSNPSLISINVRGGAMTSDHSGVITVQWVNVGNGSTYMIAEVQHRDTTGYLIQDASPIIGPMLNPPAETTGGGVGSGMDQNMGACISDDKLTIAMSAWYTPNVSNSQVWILNRTTIGQDFSLAQIIQNTPGVYTRFGQDLVCSSDLTKIYISTWFDESGTDSGPNGVAFWQRNTTTSSWQLAAFYVSSGTSAMPNRPLTLSRDGNRFAYVIDGGTLQIGIQTPYGSQTLSPASIAFITSLEFDYYGNTLAIGAPDANGGLGTTLIANWNQENNSFAIQSTISGTSNLTGSMVSLCQAGTTLLRTAGNDSLEIWTRPTFISTSWSLNMIINSTEGFTASSRTNVHHAMSATGESITTVTGQTNTTFGLGNQLVESYRWLPFDCPVLPQFTFVEELWSDSNNTATELYAQAATISSTSGVVVGIGGQYATQSWADIYTPTGNGSYILNTDLPGFSTFTNIFGVVASEDTFRILTGSGSGGGDAAHFISFSNSTGRYYISQTVSADRPSVGDVDLHRNGLMGGIGFYDANNSTGGKIEIYRLATADTQSPQTYRLIQTIYNIYNIGDGAGTDTWGSSFAFTAYPGFMIVPYAGSITFRTDVYKWSDRDGFTPWQNITISTSFINAIITAKGNRIIWYEILSDSIHVGFRVSQLNGTTGFFMDLPPRTLFALADIGSTGPNGLGLTSNDDGTVISFPIGGSNGRYSVFIDSSGGLDPTGPWYFAGTVPQAPDETGTSSQGNSDNDKHTITSDCTTMVASVLDIPNQFVGVYHINNMICTPMADPSPYPYYATTITLPAGLGWTSQYYGIATSATSDGSGVIIGGFDITNNRTFAVVFDYNVTYATWTQRGVIIGSATNDVNSDFLTVRLSDSKFRAVIATAPLNPTGIFPAHTLSYYWNSSASTYILELDAFSTNNISVGESMDLSRDGLWMVVAATSINNTNAAIYVYRLPAWHDTDPVAPVPVQNLTAIGLPFSGRWGGHICLSAFGQTLAVANSNGGFWDIYQLDSGGNTYLFQERINMSTTFFIDGFALSGDGNVVAVNFRGTFNSTFYQAVLLSYYNNVTQQWSSNFSLIESQNQVTNTSLDGAISMNDQGTLLIVPRTENASISLYDLYQSSTPQTWTYVNTVPWPLSSDGSGQIQQGVQYNDARSLTADCKLIFASGQFFDGVAVYETGKTCTPLTMPTEPPGFPPVFNPPITPPVSPPGNPPVTPPVEPPVSPPINPPVTPPVEPPVEPPVPPPVNPPAIAPANSPIMPPVEVPSSAPVEHPIQPPNIQTNAPIWIAFTAVLVVLGAAIIGGIAAVGYINRSDEPASEDSFSETSSKWPLRSKRRRT